MNPNAWFEFWDVVKKCKTLQVLHDDVDIDFLDQSFIAFFQKFLRLIMENNEIGFTRLIKDIKTHEWGVLSPLCIVLVPKYEIDPNFFHIIQARSKEIYGISKIDSLSIIELWKCGCFDSTDVINCIPKYRLGLNEALIDNIFKDNYSIDYGKYTILEYLLSQDDYYYFFPSKFFSKISLFSDEKRNRLLDLALDCIDNEEGWEQHKFYCGYCYSSTEEEGNEHRTRLYSKFGPDHICDLISDYIIARYDNKSHIFLFLEYILKKKIFCLKLITKQICETIKTFYDDFSDLSSFKSLFLLLLNNGLDLHIAMECLVTQFDCTLKSELNLLETQFKEYLFSSEEKSKSDMIVGDWFNMCITVKIIKDWLWERRGPFVLFWVSTCYELAYPYTSDQLEKLEEYHKKRFELRRSFLTNPANKEFITKKMTVVLFSPNSLYRRTIASYL